MASMPWGQRKTSQSPPNASTGGVAVPSSSQHHIAYDNAGVGSVKQPSANMPGNATEYGVSQSSKNLLNSNATEFEPATLTAPISFLNRGSTADADAANDGGRLMLTGVAGPGQSLPSPIAPPLVGSGDIVNSSAPCGMHFTTDTGPQAKWVGGHYIGISNVDRATWSSTIKTLNAERGWAGSMLHITVTPSEADETKLEVAACVDDVESAAQAEADVHLVDQKAEFRYITYHEYITAIGLDKQKMQEPPSPHDGQVLLDATYHGPPVEINAEQLRASLRHLAGDFDRILAFVIIETSPTQWQVRIEFFKISAARAMIKMLKQSPEAWYFGWEITLPKMHSGSDCEPDVSHMLSDGLNSLDLTPRKNADYDSVVHFSPTGRTSWAVDGQGNVVYEAPHYRMSKTQTQTGHDSFIDTPARHVPEPTGHSYAMYDPSVAYNSSGSFPSTMTTPHHHGNKKDDPDGPQVVKVQRIIEGSDVRTTIMVRNVPSGWDLTRFLVALNAVIRNGYNFSYLRMDFARGTNVGYAFVNVVDAMDIVAFTEYWVGKEWDPAMSPGKVCQVSYATVQGIDCLIEKFRNSSILDEYPGFTPKLWWVPQDAPHNCTEDQVGQERPFPPPNNATKHQRSHDNAGSIGLYAPRSSARGDRARRSNFDRGTPRQVQEESQATSSPFEANYAIGAPRAPIGPPVPYFAHPSFPAMPYPAYYFGHPGYVGQPPHGYPAAYADNVDPFTVVPAGHYPLHQPNGHGNLVAPQPQNNPYGMNQNPASRLRTITQGHLGSRHRNVTVAPNGYSGYPDAATAGPSRVPRSFMAAGEFAASDGAAYANRQGFINQQSAEYHYDN